ncbi:MAG: Uncharacterized protein XE11_0512 [Methanomicrobiales archaeon 53_19]|jgi:hypothetical protein|uniref:hypothetical protein n=1 Tax=Methanocalculus sp. TaxID=2004547 RepID=UPI00074B0F6A|nr:hypothetical protein [Methanocalculus sp.]KUK71189.1 MAG: Uncharacterized protein XD88_0182 [Methanocalculus sp. 52_23]KUL04732.1 MAG: Uncharacterized protein XE11_0512 [Methanomicrobiales archaeon 53_19]HIJ06948.1 hypothetical protein [Methanocalculus sp.]
MEDAELFDLVIPPGVPRTIIRTVMENYNVELVPHNTRLSFANMDGDERELLAFRGEKEEVERVEAFMFEELKKFIN